MLLIFPPVAKPSEPPAGIARLAATLHDAGLPCRVLDGNCEGLLWLMEQPQGADDNWSRRAVNSRERHLATLREPRSYRSPDRYGRAVSDLNRLLAIAGQGVGAMVGLADYQQQGLSPLRSADLLRAAEHPEQNPFFPWFSKRLPQLLDGVRMVGFSLNYLSQALCTFAMMGYVRQQFPGVTMALGGGAGDVVDEAPWLAHPLWWPGGSPGGGAGGSGAPRPGRSP